MRALLASVLVGVLGASEWARTVTVDPTTGFAEVVLAQGNDQRVRALMTRSDDLGLVVSAVFRVQGQPVAEFLRAGEVRSFSTVAGGLSRLSYIADGEGNEAILVWREDGGIAEGFAVDSEHGIQVMTETDLDRVRTAHATGSQMLQAVHMER